MGGNVLQSVPWQFSGVLAYVDFPEGLECSYVNSSFAIYRCGSHERCRIRKYCALRRASVARVAPNSLYISHRIRNLLTVSSAMRIECVYATQIFCMSARVEM